MGRKEIHAATLCGSGSQTLILAHGFGTCQRAWRHVQPQLAGACQTLTFDYVGCGRADPSAYDSKRYSSLDGYAEDLIELLDECQLRGTTFVSHSVSGMIGMLAAQKRPELFSRLIMLAPSPCFYNDGNYIGGFERDELEELVQSLELNYYDWADQAAPQIMGRPDRPELATDLAASLKRTDATLAKRFARLVFTQDQRGKLAALQTPTTVAQCRDDMLAPPSVGAFMKQQIPHCELVDFPVTGHCPHLSAVSETVGLIRARL